MRKLIKKFIDKHIIEILKIFNQGKEKIIFSELQNYYDDKIYFAVKHLIRLIEERGNENGRRKS